jgi:hypothetical protein
MARGGRGAEDLVNPTGGDVSDASEPRIWCHRVGGTRASSVARTRASAGRPRARERRSAAAVYLYGAELPRVGGDRACLRRATGRETRRESVTAYTVYTACSLRQRPPKRDRQSDRSRGSGFGVRGVGGRARRRGADHGRARFLSYNVAYLQRNAAAGKGTTSPPGNGRYRGVTCISRYILLRETASGRDGAERGCRL